MNLHPLSRHISGLFKVDVFYLIFRLAFNTLMVSVETQDRLYSGATGELSGDRPAGAHREVGRVCGSHLSHTPTQRKGNLPDDSPLYA